MMRWLLLALLIALPHAAMAEKEVTSVRAAIVYSEDLIEGGEFDEAIAFLDRATQMYPEDDRLLTLYGQALYESRRIREAEEVFMRAMRLNPLNIVAKNYVDVIRGIKVARDSEQAQMFESVAWDKAWKSSWASTISAPFAAAWLLCSNTSRSPSARRYSPITSIPRKTSIHSLA